VSEQQTSTAKARELLLMVIAFSGIFLYGLLAALTGSMLSTLERNQFLPNDSAVGTFLLINAIGAVLAYVISGPIIDRIGKKFALLFGTALVITSMIGFALTVTRVQAPGLVLTAVKTARVRRSACFDAEAVEHIRNRSASSQC